MAYAAPVELLLVRFPENRFRGEIMTAIEKLVKNRIIKIIDVLVISKDKSGNVTVAEMNELDKEDYIVLETVVAETRGLLTEDDAKDISKELENNSSAGLMLFEDTWAGELAEAIDRAGGEVVVSERVPRAALEELSA